MRASQFQESFRIIKDLSRNQFDAIFEGMDAEWLNDRYRELKKSVESFVLHLDEANMERLFDHLGDRLDKLADEENIRLGQERMKDKLLGNAWASKSYK